MKVLVDTFNQEKVLVGALSVIVKSRGPSFQALMITLSPQPSVRALEQTWHPEHFQCHGCLVVFADNMSYREKVT